GFTVVGAGETGAEVLRDPTGRSQARGIVARMKPPGLAFGKPKGELREMRGKPVPGLRFAPSGLRPLRSLATATLRQRPRRAIPSAGRPASSRRRRPTA